MNYATTLVKSTYKGTKSAAKYVGSYIIPHKKTPQPKYSWVSCLVIFKTPHNKYILDQGCILVGDVPMNYHSFFTNFTNWKVHEDQLYYMGEYHDPIRNTTVVMTEINPNDVHIHFKVGDTLLDLDYFMGNPDYYLHYFSDEESRLYKTIKDQLITVPIKIIDMSEKYGSLSKDTVKERVKQIHDYRFNPTKHKIYGDNMDQVMFSEIDPAML